MKRHSHRGFTLIELVVSISIIGVLLATLVPALLLGRQMAQAGGCVSNLRRSTLAMIDYAGDYNDLLTPFQDVDDSWPNSHWSSDPDQPNGGYWWYALLRYYHYSRGTFMCPAGDNIRWWNPATQAYNGPYGNHPEPWNQYWQPINATDSPGQQQPELGWYLEDRFGAPAGDNNAISIDRTNYMAASTYGRTDWNFATGEPSSSGSWVTTNGRVGWQEALPMMDFWPYYNGIAPGNGKQHLDAIRKPTLLSAYKPAETAVLFDGLLEFRFDKNFWSFIHLRHLNHTAATFAFIDGHAETRDWTRMPPGIRTAGSGRDDPYFDPIPGPGTYGSTTQLRNLLGTATDGTLSTSPRVNHGMRFIVPRVILGTTTQLGD